MCAIFSGRVIYEEASKHFQKYIYASGKIIVEIRGNVNCDIEKFYYYQDNLGSTMLLTQQDGRAVCNQDYLPYGENLSALDFEGVLIQSGHMYTGQYEEMAIGLYYYNSRYYDPETGRFTREDEYQGDLYRPQTQHAFVYALGNPLKYMDTTGYWSEVYINGRKYAVVDSKTDTLWGLSEKIFGKGSKWPELGYTDNPKTLQMGEMIDITDVINKVNSEGQEIDNNTNVNYKGENHYKLKERMWFYKIANQRLLTITGEEHKTVVKEADYEKNSCFAFANWSVKGMLVTLEIEYLQGNRVNIWVNAFVSNKDFNPKEDLPRLKIIIENTKIFNGLWRTIKLKREYLISPGTIIWEYSVNTTIVEPTNLYVFCAPPIYDTEIFTIPVFKKDFTAEFSLFIQPNKSETPFFMHIK